LAKQRERDSKHSFEFSNTQSEFVPLLPPSPDSSGILLTIGKERKRMAGQGAAIALQPAAPEKFSASKSGDFSERRKRDSTPWV